MSLQETDRRRRQSLFQQDDNRVLSFRQWIELNGISDRTGRRILNSGKGPTVIQLSPRRIGVTVRANREWQASRARG